MSNKRNMADLPPSSEKQETARIYWDTLGHDRGLENPDQLWRRYSDAIHIWWLEQEMSVIRGKRVLKTDLFDEAFGDGLAHWLEEQGADVVACDLAFSTAELAVKKQASVSAAVADVRFLPFRTGSFDYIVSDSTLDHFEAERDIQRSLHELFRVLRPGGILLLTMDNPSNPIVWLRNQRPQFWRQLGVVPYMVGITCNSSRLRQLLRTAGFKVSSSGTIMHSPRVLLVPICRWLQKYRKKQLPGSSELSWLHRFEKMKGLPFHQLTGHFITVLGQKKQ